MPRQDSKLPVSAAAIFGHPYLVNSLAEAAVTAAGPTTGIAAAAQDEISVAISSMFGNFGQEFQLSLRKRRRSISSSSP